MAAICYGLLGVLDVPAFRYEGLNKQQMQTCLQGKLEQTVCKIFIRRYVDQLV